MILLTERLRLEPVRCAHAAVMFPLLSDPQLYIFLPSDPPNCLDALEKRYALLESGRSPDGSEHWLNWTIFDRWNGAPFGTFQATVRDDGPSDIAYMVGAKYWRRGIAHEAGVVVIDRVFSKYSTLLLAANLDTRNIASMHLVEALGFTRVATIPDADNFKGTTSHEYRYELRRSAWRR